MNWWKSQRATSSSELLPRRLNLPASNGMGPHTPTKWIKCQKEGYSVFPLSSEPTRCATCVASWTLFSKVPRIASLTLVVAFLQNRSTSSVRALRRLLRSWQNERLTHRTAKGQSVCKRKSVVCKRKSGIGKCTTQKQLREKNSIIGKIVLVWVDFHFGSSDICPITMLRYGNLAELAGQLGNTLEHPNQSQPNPGLSPPDSPCRT